MSTVGLIASPSAGKDVRRLVANAGSVGDVDKIASIRRAAIGAIEGGASRLLVLDDSRHLVLRAMQDVVSDLDLAAEVEVEALDLELMGTGRDSARAAAAMAKEDVPAVVVFGGDGTSRDVAKGWPDAVMVPLAVGTNNVFPSHIEPTLGGLAAGLIASGVVERDDAAVRCKVIHVTTDATEADRALVDVVAVEGDFIGSRAVWEIDDLVSAVFATAVPSSVGLSAIGGALDPIEPTDDVAIAVEFGDGDTAVRVPIAPGTYRTVPVASHRRLALGDDVVEIAGPCVLAFDGERDHVLGPDEVARITVRRDGPWVIDPERAIAVAADQQFFQTPQ